jgi:hypothetical protein
MEAIVKTLRALIVAAVLGCGLVDAAEASEFCASPVIRAWLAERDAAAMELVKAWLRQANADTLRKASLELIRWEVLISPCVPPLRSEDLYVGDQADPDRLPASVLVVLLRKQGIDLDPSGYLAGQTFRVKTRE